MKKYLEKLSVFKSGLKLYAFLALKGFSGLVRWLTSVSAWLNLKLNKPDKEDTTEALAETWVDLMPPDGRELFKIASIEGDTAYTEIHLHCPLRGSGNVKACHQLMNYDRKLMDKVGANLVVLESQSNSGKPFCRLAIRKHGLPTDDLVPAHLVPKD